MEIDYTEFDKIVRRLINMKDMDQSEIWICIDKLNRFRHEKLTKPNEILFKNKNNDQNDIILNKIQQYFINLPANHPKKQIINIDTISITNLDKHISVLLPDTIELDYNEKDQLLEYISK